jgi:hypothetical protein
MPEYQNERTVKGKRAQHRRVTGSAQNVGWGGSIGNTNWIENETLEANWEDQPGTLKLKIGKETLEVMAASAEDLYQNLKIEK